MQVCGSSGNGPSAECHERLSLESSDSTVAMYKQVHGITSASTMRLYIQHIRECAPGPNLLQQPHIESQAGCYTPGLPDMRGNAAFVTQQRPYEDEQHMLLHCPSSMTIEAIKSD